MYIFLCFFSCWFTREMDNADPFKKVKLDTLQNKMLGWMKDNNVDYTMNQDVMKKRRRKVVCKSFLGVGLCVPLDKKTQVGYREIPETNGKSYRNKNLL